MICVRNLRLEHKKNSNAVYVWFSTLSLTEVKSGITRQWVDGNLKFKLHNSYKLKLYLFMVLLIICIVISKSKVGNLNTTKNKGEDGNNDTITI